MLEAASLNGIRSGVAEVVFEILDTDQKNSLVLHLALGFDRRGQEGLQPFFLSIGSTGRRDGRFFEFNGRLFYAPAAATLVYGPAFKEQTYVPDRTEFESFKSKLEVAQEEGGAGDISACPGAAAGTSLESLIRAPEYKGITKDPEGTRLFLVGGEVNVPGLTDLLVHLAEDADCGVQMKAIGLPSPTELRTMGAELGQHAEDGRAILGVDKHGLPRSFEATLDSASSQTGKAELKFDFSLREVNEQVEVPAEAAGKPLDPLLQKFGVESEAARQAGGDELLLGLLEGFGGGAAGRLP